MPNIEIDNFKSATGGSGIDEENEKDFAEGTNYIITIGIDTYKNPALKLKSCVNDCNALVKILTEQYSFEAFEESLLNENATKKGILDLLERFRISKKLTTNDSLILYFSGHGHLFPLPGNEKIGCWVPQEAMDQQLKNLLKLPDVIDEIKQFYLILK